MGRKVKKTIKVLFGDGKLFTVMDREYDEQTQLTTIYMRRGGNNFMLPIIIAMLGGFVGFMSFNMNGAFIGAVSGFAGGTFATIFLIPTSKIKKVSVPEKAFLGVSSTSILSERTHVLYVPNYESTGNARKLIDNPVAQVVKDNENLESMINYLHDWIKTLQYRLIENHKTGGAVVEEVADQLGAIGKSVAEFRLTRGAMQPVKSPMPIPINTQEQDQ